MMRGISISDIVLYIIATVVIVGLSFYFAFFISAQYSVSLNSDTYLLFLNSLYSYRINYCLYNITSNPTYLFFFLKDMDFSNIKGIHNCFSKVITNVRVLEGNYSTYSDDDLKRLSLSICGQEDSNFISFIENNYKNCDILIYREKNISSVPIFSYYDIYNSKLGWITETARSLLDQEESQKGFLEGLLENIFKVVSPIGYLAYEYLKDYYKNLLFESLKTSSETFISCNLDREYSIFPLYSVQNLVVDTNRRLYVLSTMHFSKVKSSGNYIIMIVNHTNRKIDFISLSSLRSGCISIP